MTGSRSFSFATFACALKGRAGPQPILVVAELGRQLASERALPDGQTATDRNVGQAWHVPDEIAVPLDGTFGVVDCALQTLLQPDHRPVPLVSLCGHEMRCEQRVEVHTDLGLPEKGPLQTPGKARRVVR